jgi:hypothetical protein
MDTGLLAGPGMPAAIRTMGGKGDKDAIRMKTNAVAGTGRIRTMMRMSG